MKKVLMYQNINGLVNFTVSLPVNFAITFKVNFTKMSSSLSAFSFGVGTLGSIYAAKAYVMEGISIVSGSAIDIVYNKGSIISMPKSIFPLNKWVDVIMFVKNSTVTAKVSQDINTVLFNSSTSYNNNRNTNFGIFNLSSGAITDYIDDIRIWDTTDLTFLQVEKYDQIYNLTLDSTNSPKLLHRIITKNGTLQCVGAKQETINWYSGSATFVNMDMYPYSDRNVIIKDNGKYYSFKSDNYDQTSQMYNEITDLDANNFDDYAEGSPALCENVTIGTETFRPIDKFTDPHIIIQDNKDIAVTGIKKDAGMAVLLTPISFKRFSRIKALAANKSIDASSEIRLVFSFDNGASWYTYPNLIDKWKPINVDIPLKQFSKLNSTEKQSWENSKAEILSNGIDINNINIVEDITTDMMIAIVVKIDSYSSIATLNNIQVTYDGAKTLSRLDNSECGVTIEGDTITLTPQVTCDELLLSIITSF